MVTYTATELKSKLLGKMKLDKVGENIVNMVIVDLGERLERGTWEFPETGSIDFLGDTGYSEDDVTIHDFDGFYNELIRNTEEEHDDGVEGVAGGFLERCSEHYWKR